MGLDLDQISLPAHNTGGEKNWKPGCNSQALNHTKPPTNGWRAETGSHQPREGLHVTGVEASKVKQETFKFQFPGPVTVINLELRLSTHVSSHAQKQDRGNGRRRR